MILKAKILRQQIKLTGASATSSGSSSNSGSAGSLSAGIILDDHSKINFTYFSGTDSDESALKATVVGVSYDYCFNNYGEHKGFYLGAGLSSVKTEIVESSSLPNSSESSLGALLRVGLEYKINDNFLFDTGFNINSATQKHEYTYKTNSNIEGSSKFSVSSFHITLNYLF